MICRMTFLANECYEHFDVFDSIFVFGSALWSDSPRDLDILLIYEDSKLSLISSAEARIIDALAEYLPDLPIHLTTLSQSELVSTDFLNKINYVKVK